MDINKDLYFYAITQEQLSNDIILEGFALNGTSVGIDIHKLDILGNGVWAIGANRILIPVETLFPTHISRWGWKLAVSCDESLALPVLLTTNRELRPIYSGAASVSALQTSDEAGRPIGTSIPVASEHWIGVLFPNDGSYQLLAYSDEISGMPHTFKAWCPEWFDNSNEGGQMLVCLLSDL